jgi:hypothetical protein
MLNIIHGHASKTMYMLLVLMPSLDHYGLESSLLIGYTLLHLLLGHDFGVLMMASLKKSIIVGSWMGGFRHEGVIF